jgi:hypothetical protein
MRSQNGRRHSRVLHHLEPLVDGGKFRVEQKGPASGEGKSFLAAGFLQLNTEPFPIRAGGFQKAARHAMVMDINGASRHTLPGLCARFYICFDRAIRTLAAY